MSESSVPKVFSGAEVLRMAAEMEQIGQTFYESLAGAADDPKVANLCRQLATAEAHHYQEFQRLLAHLVRPGTGPWVTEQQTEAARALVKGRVLPRIADVRKVALGGNLAEAVKLAREMEQDAVRFYELMLTVVPLSDRPAVTQIIQQERTHLRELNELPF